jgi:putative iron-regulated protein
MEVPLASQDQEDEQSCFSDNTHRDIVGNTAGIEAVWLGRYVADDGRALTGASLRDLVADRDGVLADRVTRQMAQSVAAARAIRPPFDREIVGDRDAPGRARVRATIDSVVAQAASLVEAARALGLQRLNGFRAP